MVRAFVATAKAMTLSGGSCGGKSGDVYEQIGRQLNDAMFKKKDRDGRMLFLYFGTVWGPHSKWPRVLPWWMWLVRWIRV